jgi:hypothetical protein
MLSKIRLAALTTTAFVGMTTAVQADPISALILTTVGLSATTIGATAFGIATSVLTMGLGLGASLLAQAISGKPKPQISGTTGKLSTGGVVPRTIPFGRTPVSHSLVYANTDGRSGKTPNAILTQVFSLSDVPVAGLAEIWMNGSKLTWTRTSGAVLDAGPFGWGIEVDGFPGHLWVRFYDGTQTTADASLVSRFGTDPIDPYGADRIGVGVAYVIVTCLQNRTYFPGFPTFKFIVDGVRLYDPRQDTTAGGLGVQRWNDQSTWTAPAPVNPVVAAYNIKRGMRYGSQWIFGGQTISANQLPLSAWASAMNECDVAITLQAGGSEPQYRCSGEIKFEDQPLDVVKKIMATCNGRIGERGGIYKPKVGAAGVAVFSITDDDIMVDDQSTFDPFRSLDSVVNGITAKYIEPREGWSAKDAPAIYNATFEAADGGRRQTADVGLEFVNSATQVQRIMASTLAEARRERRHGLPMPPQAFPLEPNDFVSWTSPRNGYVSKLFRVDQVRDVGSLVMGLGISEVDPADYDWLPSNERPVFIGSTAPPVVPIQVVQSWNAVGILVTSPTSTRQIAGIRATWDGDQEDIIGVDLEVWNSARTTLIYEETTFRFELGVADITANIIAETAYSVRGRYRPRSERPVGYSGWINVTTPAIPTEPGSVDISMLAADLFNRVDQQSRDADIAFDLLLQDAQAVRETTTLVEQQVSYGVADARVRDEITLVASDLGATARRVATVEAQVTDLDTGLPALSAQVEIAQEASVTATTAVSNLTLSTDAAFGGSVAGTVARFSSFANAGITEAGYQLLAFNTINGITYSVGLTAYAGPSGRGVVLGGSGAQVRIDASSFLIGSTTSGVYLPFVTATASKVTFTNDVEILGDIITPNSLNAVFDIAIATTGVSTVANGVAYVVATSGTTNLRTARPVLGSCRVGIRMFGAGATITWTYSLQRLQSGSWVTDTQLRIVTVPATTDVTINLDASFISRASETDQQWRVVGVPTVGGGGAEIQLNVAGAFNFFQPRFG